MGRTIELPDELYAALVAAAEASGTTPEGWLAGVLPVGAGDRSEGQQRGASLADRFAGRVGRIRSGGRERLSEDCAARFTDHLEAKRRASSL